MRKPGLLISLILLTAGFSKAQNLIFAKQIGSIDFTEVVSQTVDSQEFIYITGVFSGPTDLDPGPGQFIVESEGMEDFYVCKLDPNGEFLWGTSIGGSLTDDVMDIDVDPEGNIYLTGDFTGTVDFDPGVGSVELHSGSLESSFILKLDSLGQFQWVNKITSYGICYTSGLDVNSNGDVAIVGGYSDSVTLALGSFDTTFFSQNPLKGRTFFMELSSDGEPYWVLSLDEASGSGKVWFEDIKLDDDRNLISTGGVHQGIDADPGIGELNLYGDGDQGGDFDIIVHSLDSTGALNFAFDMGNFGDERGLAIDFDESGNIYVGGYIESATDFDPGVGFQPAAPEWYGTNGFVAKYSYLGGLVSVADWVWQVPVALTVTGDGKVFFGYDHGLAEVDFTGDTIGWTYNCGGHIAGLDITDSEELISSGRFFYDFQPGQSPITLNSLGGSDGFVSKHARGYVGVEEKGSPSMIQAFPNPTAHATSIQFNEPVSSGAIRVFDSTGRLLDAYAVDAGSTLEIALDGAPGIYAVEFRNDERTEIIRVVKN